MSKPAVVAGYILCCLVALSGLAVARAHRSSQTGATSIVVRPRAGAHAAHAKTTARILSKLSRTIDRDFRVRARRLKVRMYSSHLAFARELLRTEHLWPEGIGDNTSNIVRGVLRLGPGAGRDKHRLAHVYTEWILDRLTHNTSDLQPRPAWLYDGLAEFEADRVAGTAMCRRTGDVSLPLSRLASPASWWKIRGTPFGPLEYCEAESRVSRLLSHLSWDTVLHRLETSGSWTRFARRITGQKS